MAFQDKAHTFLESTPLAVMYPPFTQEYRLHSESPSRTLKSKETDVAPRHWTSGQTAQIEAA